MEYPDIPERLATSPSPPSTPIDDDDGRPASPEIPLTMAASAVLTALPRDASSALAAAGEFDQDKVVVRFKPVGGAPQLARNSVRKISASQKFEAVVAHLRKALRLAPTEGLFLYVNSAFAPALDEVVGNLHRCFKDSNGQLIVVYSITPAFG
ncbi:ubiquitin-like protein ATG12 [Microdochium nivale]|nr:ubiquitin-like protein ATG12 [Microdochium nivale]